MRPQVVRPPTERMLEEAPLNALIRLYPELLAVLAEQGIDPTESGGLPLTDVVSDSEALQGVVGLLGAASAWRAQASARGAVSLPTNDDR